jgi:hypothetical protein
MNADKIGGPGKKKKKEGREEKKQPISKLVKEETTSSVDQGKKEVGDGKENIAKSGKAAHDFKEIALQMESVSNKFGGNPDDN